MVCARNIGYVINKDSKVIRISQSAPE